MKILCLYDNPCALELFEWLRKQGHSVYFCRDLPEDTWCRENNFDLTVSYTYRFILPRTTLNALNNNAVNLHNSYLPWNRGADPNIWSILEDTPRGVTLHYIDERLDKGDIIAQSFVGLDKWDTLKTSYDALDTAAKELFKQAFVYYPYWPEMRKRAMGKGTYHSSSSGKGIKRLFRSYDMLAEELRNRLI